MGRLKGIAERGNGMKAFENAETILSATDRRVAFTRQDLIGRKEEGSYNVIAARLFGLSYPEYLRYVRENYNGVIMGKGGYSYIIFKNSSDCDKLVKELNRRWDMVLKERTKRGLRNN